MIVERLGEDDARDGFLLDGFPRTIEQADALADELDAHERRLTAALLIDAPDELVVARISGRRIVPYGAATSTTSTSTRPSRDRCDVDGSELVQRDDDREDDRAGRLAVYHAQTEPLIAYYEERGLLRALRRHALARARSTATSAPRWRRCASRSTL